MDGPLDHWQQCADACDEGALGDHRRGHIALACCFQAGMALPWKKQHCIAKLPEKQQLIDKNITTFILIGFRKKIPETWSLYRVVPPFGSNLPFPALFCQYLWQLTRLA